MSGKKDKKAQQTTQPVIQADVETAQPTPVNREVAKNYPTRSYTFEGETYTKPVRARFSAVWSEIERVRRDVLEAAEDYYRSGGLLDNTIAAAYLLVSDLLLSAKSASVKSPSLAANYLVFASSLLNRIESDFANIGPYMINNQAYVHTRRGYKPEFEFYHALREAVEQAKKERLAFGPNGVHEFMRILADENYISSDSRIETVASAVLRSMRHDIGSGGYGAFERLKLMVGNSMPSRLMNATISFLRETKPLVTVFDPVSNTYMTTDVLSAYGVGVFSSPETAKLVSDPSMFGMLRHEFWSLFGENTETISTITDAMRTMDSLSLNAIAMINASREIATAILESSKGGKKVSDGEVRELSATLLAGMPDKVSLYPFANQQEKHDILSKAIELTKARAAVKTVQDTAAQIEHKARVEAQDAVSAFMNDQNNAHIVSALADAIRDNLPPDQVAGFDQYKAVYDYLVAYTSKGISPLVAAQDLTRKARVRFAKTVLSDAATDNVSVYALPILADMYATGVIDKNELLSLSPLRGQAFTQRAREIFAREASKFKLAVNNAVYRSLIEGAAKEELKKLVDIGLLRNNVFEDIVRFATVSKNIRKITDQATLVYDQDGDVKTVILPNGRPATEQELMRFASQWQSFLGSLRNIVEQGLITEEQFEDAFGSRYFTVGNKIVSGFSKYYPRLAKTIFWVGQDKERAEAAATGFGRKYVSAEQFFKTYYKPEAGKDVVDLLNRYYEANEAQIQLATQAHKDSVLIREDKAKAVRPSDSAMTQVAVGPSAEPSQSFAAGMERPVAAQKKAEDMLVRELVKLKNPILYWRY